MFRWKYLISRFFVLGFVAVIIWLTLNPVLRWSLIRSGQAVTGAKIEIAQLKSLLSKAELQLTTLAVADPQRPMQNLFQADAAVLDIDMGQLLRRRLVINQGHVTGVRLNTQRISTGALPTSVVPQVTGPTRMDKAAEVGEQWLEQAAQKLGKQIEGDLESVALGRELMRRWPNEYQRFEIEAKSIRDRGERLAKTVRQTKDNPLQSIEHYQAILGEAERMRQDTLRLRQKLTKLQQQMQLDRVAMDQAKERDWQYIQQQLQLAQLDSEAISNYLLGPEMGPRASKLIQWLRWGREQFRAGGSPPASTRGWDVILPGMQQHPTFLVRQLRVDGGGTAAGQPFSFVGQIEGITNQPQIYGKPATLNISTEGSVVILVQAVLDHTTDVARDHITVECPQLTQPARTLGSADKLAVHVGKGQSQLRIDLHLTDNQLEGTIQFHQPSVDLKVEVSDQLGGKQVADRIAMATSAIQDLHAVVRLEGTLREPRWKLDSNLGTQLAAGLRTALSQEVQHRQQQLLAKVNQELDRQLLRVRDEISAKQRELLSELDLDSEELRIVRDELAKLNLPAKLLGEKGLLRDLFRR